MERQAEKQALDQKYLSGNLKILVEIVVRNLKEVEVAAERLVQAVSNQETAEHLKELEKVVFRN